MADIKDKVITVESLSALHEHNKETYMIKTAEGLNSVLADGATVLSSYQYGDELPEAGTVGRIFFKRLYNPKYDINSDGIVNETDSNIILEHYSGTEVITDADTLERADVNKDGVINAFDSQEILDYIQSN